MRLQKNDGFEMTSFWLANTSRLLHCLKQYSGDEVRSVCKTISGANVIVDYQAQNTSLSSCSGVYDAKHQQTERTLSEEL